MDGGTRVEHLDHGGDAGLRVAGDDPAAVLAAAALAMVRLAVPRGEIRPQHERRVAVSGHDAAELLVNWLAEVHGLMAERGEIYGGFAIDELRLEGPPPLRLAATLRGEPRDPGRHEMVREIKAVTHHAAELRGTAGGWRAQVIFDI